MDHASLTTKFKILACRTSCVFPILFKTAAHESVRDGDFNRGDRRRETTRFGVDGICFGGASLWADACDGTFEE
jgi:hypothetical protein